MIKYRNLRAKEAQDFWNLMNQLDHELNADLLSLMDDI